jgi:hypothetical protein
VFKDISVVIYIMNLIAIISLVLYMNIVESGSSPYIPCDESAACTGIERCVNGVCMLPCGNTICLPNTDPNQNQLCLNGNYCGIPCGKSTCNVNNGETACVNGKCAIPCESSYCFVDDNESCLEGICQKPCSETNPCKTFMGFLETCIDGKCVMPCNPSNCRADLNQFCGWAGCDVLCGSSSCLSDYNEMCVNNKCVQSCSGKICDINNHEFCENGECRVNYRKYIRRNHVLSR